MLFISITSKANFEVIVAIQRTPKPASKFKQTLVIKIHSGDDAILKVFANHVRYVFGLDLIQSISAPI